MISTTTTLTSQLQVHTSRQVPRLTRSISHVCVTSPRGLVLAVHSGRIATQRRRQDQTLPKHFFSTTSTNQLRDFFPSKDTPHIQRTKPAWPHHGYTMEEMLAVEPVHRKPRNMSDWAAWKIVRFARFWMDKMTGMGRAQQVDKKHPTTAVVAEKPLTEAQWLVRFVFLESVAGVPGMVGGMLRHLSSLRRMKRDNGWIETLLEESYNERMHLLTFMKMCEPGWFMKLMIIGAQGVFFNALFVAYLLHPRIVHRFVGYLEEEAVHTYTRAIREIERGDLPKWSDPNFQIPDIAIGYWNMPEGHRTMRDLILYIRADEAGHRGVNHTFGNLNQNEDPNPFVSTFKDREVPKPALRGTGYERSEVI
ncbi:Alternative oxidase, mitochondrial precursor [Claviceps arundinis]|uniref:Alternative oxidase n=2 Tax=Claviceps TaxID=5110 RepID=A0A9P7MYK5_9HYPO|nr:Alternative oxidase, mitochondrial precursor [Claviceps arundinis]KAG5975828.1 Alternative oxidase, mitochondrial precursor [Claviceps arundinis]